MSLFLFLDMAYQGIWAIPCGNITSQINAALGPVLLEMRAGGELGDAQSEKCPGRSSVIFQNTRFMYLCSLSASGFWWGIELMSAELSVTCLVMSPK